MASKPREVSKSGFYHVFHRGVDLFDIFEDDEDREFYLKRLARYAFEYGIEIHAWCLMSNHTHLLLRADHKALSELMRKLGSVYARKFNMRHHRSGPLFEGRFGSVPVETDAQYVSVVRYIHRNPVLHREKVFLGDYPWSSYGEYIAAAPVYCELGFTLSMFGSLKEFVRFHEETRDRERHLDIGTAGRMLDDEARERANCALDDAGFDVLVSRIGSLPRKLRDEAIVCVRRAIGCSLRQLQRLTGIAYSAIRVAVGAEHDEYGQRRRESDLVNSSAPPLAELLAPFDAAISKPAVPLPRSTAMGRPLPIS